MTSRNGHVPASAGSNTREDRWRTLLLMVLALGAVGLTLELLLLEHWMVTPQLTPLVTLLLVLMVTVAVAFRPDRRSLRAFRAVMVWAVVAGFVGIGFHFRDNLAFEREVTPAASFSSLTWHAVRGATPLLAPGSLIQLGLVGLVFTWGHPGLRSHKETEIA